MEKVKLTRELRVLALAVLAGMAIGIGGVLYLTLENKVVGALMFTVGLYAICAHGLNLFTGKVGYLVNKPVSYLITLLEIWVGNLCGTYLAAFAVRQTRIKGISETAQAMCRIKMQDKLFSLFLLAIFCGFLMFIAVDGYRRSKILLSCLWEWPLLFFVALNTALQICFIFRQPECGQAGLFSGLSLSLLEIRLVGF